MKIIKLICNEIIKQTKKLSFKVCLTILLILSILIPIFTRNTYEEYEFDFLYREYDITALEEIKITNPQNQKDIHNNEIIDIELEVAKIAIENNIKRTMLNGDLFESYIYTSEQILCIDKYLAGDFDKNMYQNECDYDIIKNQTFEEIKIKKADFQKEKDIMYNAILTGDYKEYIPIEKQKKEEGLVFYNDEEGYAKNDLKFYEKLIEYEITKENDPRIEKILPLIELESSMEIPMPKEEYLDFYYTYGDSYETYVNSIEMSNNEIKDQLAKGWYEIEQNTSYENDLKIAMEVTNQINMVILSFITIIMAGQIVANEFQKGTIRLLIITANKRWKILLSKFLAVIILTIVLSVISYVLSTIVSMMLYGISNYFVPDLKVVSGIVTETSYLLNQLILLFCNLISVIFVGLIAFFLSTITQNTAVSVGLSIFLLLGYTIPLMLFSYMETPIAKYTFLPYLNFSQFLETETLSNNILRYGFSYNIKTAISVLTIWAISIYGFTNLVFTKKDIKN